MPEPLKQNKNLLNQLCKSLLKSEKVEVDEYHLYSLQLAEWGLENGEAEGPWKVHQALLLSQVQMLYDVQINLSTAQKLILSDPTLPPLLALKQEALKMKDQEPEWVAQELVLNLYHNLNLDLLNVEASE